MVSKKMRDGCGTFVPTLVDDAVDDDDDDDDDDARRLVFVFHTIGRTDGRTDVVRRDARRHRIEIDRGGTLTIRWCRQNDGTKRREIAATATTRSGDDRERRAGVANEGARG